MSDEGMSDAALEQFRIAVAYMHSCPEQVIMRDTSLMRALIDRLDAAERERDALREALANMANTINIVGSPYDRIQKAADELIHDVKKRARAALTANHSPQDHQP